MSDADNRPAVVGQVERPVGPHAQLVERLQDEAGLCRNEGADDIAALLEEAAAALDATSHDAEVGARWRANSSLQEWFPMTAEALIQPWAEARFGVFHEDGRFEELPPDDPVGENHPRGHTARWVGGLRDLELLHAALLALRPNLNSPSPVSHNTEAPNASH